MSEAKQMSNDAAPLERLAKQPNTGVKPVNQGLPFEPYSHIYLI